MRLALNVAAMLIVFIAFVAMFDAILANLIQFEAQMAALGARMLAPEKAGVEAAATLATRHAGEQSVLSQIAISVSIGMSRVLGWFAEWGGAAGEATCDLNRDFMPVVMDSATLTAYIAAWQGGVLSEPELFDLLKRGDVIAAAKTLEEHQGEVETAPPLGLQHDTLDLQGKQKTNEQIGMPPPLDPNKAKK